jgi:uncharacterized membrane protein
MGGAGVKKHRLAAPILASGLGAMMILATAGGSFAAGPGVVSPTATTTAVCGTVPLDVEIIVDSSGSMSSNYSGSPSHTRLYWAQAAATQLVSQLDANGGVGGASGLHHVGLTKFSGTTATVVQALGTATASQMSSSIAGLSASGNTPFKTGMSVGATDLTAHARATANHVIIFLSDGRPNPDQSGRDGLVATNSNYQRPTQSDLDAFRGSAGTIFSIAIGTGGGSGSNLVDLGLMKLLAKGPSTYYNVVDSSLLPTLFSSIFVSIACPTATPTPTDVPTATPTDVPTATPTDVPTATPTDVPTATPTESLQGETSTPAPTATPYEAFEGATGTPGGSTTPPPTSTGSNGSSSSSTSLFALLICFAFGGLGLAAVEAQRRAVRR